MQIHPGGNGPTVGLPAHPASSAATVPASVRGTADERLIGGVKVVGGQANQLATLAARLKDVPTTRDDIVQQVRERTEQGHYLTRDAAERTAANILGM
jgi:hypothetical protein